MDWGKVRFFLSEVRNNFTRNIVMQLTAIGTVTIMIVLLGTFLFTQETVGKIGGDMVRQIEISVFMSDKATPADSRALMLALRADPQVKTVVYIPKSEGLQQMRERLRGQIDTTLLTTNPLPDALRVRIATPETVHAVAARIAKMPNVANVEYQRDAVERLLRLTDVMGKIGLGFIILLVLTAAIIISNTIRLTVYARRREIAIMQLVGASSTYIRLPFICEGFIDGFLGAVLALILLAIGRWQLWPKLLSALPFIPLHDAGIDLGIFALQLLGVGAAVGIIASWISVGRYLRT
jgi:cell division transport system permease protein